MPWVINYLYNTGKILNLMIQELLVLQKIANFTYKVHRLMLFIRILFLIYMYVFSSNFASCHLVPLLLSALH